MADDHCDSCGLVLKMVRLPDGKREGPFCEHCDPWKDMLRIAGFWDRHRELRV